MQQTRLNTFTNPHKGLRAMLYDTAMCIQHTDFSDHTAALRTFERVNKVVEQFDKHAHIEDAYVFPMLQHIVPGIIADFEMQHETDEMLAKELKDIIVGYGHCITPKDRKQMGDRLLVMFNEYVAFNLQHMNKEETIINELLWANYSDAELIEAEQRIVQSIKPLDMALFIPWIVRGLNNTELIYWMSSVKQHAPEHVYQHLCDTAAKELDPIRWETLSKVVLPVAA